jgi:predicted metalloprotease
MSFRPGAKFDPSQVEDRRGRRAGGPILVGGGGIGLIILIATLLLGGDPTQLLTQPTAGLEGYENAPSAQECDTAEEANTRDDCRVVGFVNSVQAYWTEELPRRGMTYRPARTVLFSDYVQAECGTASAAQGPFYCPLDEKVYLDLTFFRDLRSRFGARGGPFAEAYVIAHEYGHHVQHILGGLEGGSSVPLELQADCLAGVWVHHASATGFLNEPTDADLAAALDAAAAVGDDRIQQETQGRVTPESWTHGSSAQRQEALRTGMRTGDLASCPVVR